MSLTVAARLSALDTPATFAERLPKALIHRNVPGQPVYEYLRAFDSAWRAARPYAAFGARQRWVHTVSTLRANGWPIMDRPNRWRLGEATIGWSVLT